MMKQKEVVDAFVPSINIIFSFFSVDWHSSPGTLYYFPFRKGRRRSRREQWPTREVIGSVED